MAQGLGFIEFSTGDVLSAAAANGYLASQTVMVFADAAARTAAITTPYEGMISYLKSTDATEYYSGSAWVAIGGASGAFTFSAYTPTYTSLTIGNGTVTARYGQSGKFVTVNWRLVWGSTTSFTSTLPTISLPVTASSVNAVGSAYFLDAATLEQIGVCRPTTTTTLSMILPQNGTYGASQPSASFPWTWTTNDEIRLSITYEAV